MIFDCTISIFAAGWWSYNILARRPWWLIRNSWAEDWGEDGHMRILRESQACTIAWTPTYPILECREGSNCTPVSDVEANTFEGTYYY